MIKYFLFFAFFMSCASRSTLFNSPNDNLQLDKTQFYTQRIGNKIYYIHKDNIGKIDLDNIGNNFDISQKNSIVTYKHKKSKPANRSIATSQNAEKSQHFNYFKNHLRVKTSLSKDLQAILLR